MNQHFCTSEADSCMCQGKIITSEAQSGSRKTVKKKEKK
jgi:hypothetical protein